MKSMATPNRKPDSVILTYGPTLIVGMLIGWILVAGMSGQFN